MTLKPFKGRRLSSARKCTARTCGRSRPCSDIRRHKNLEWMDVVALIEHIGVVHEKGNNKFTFAVGGELVLMLEPHTKNLTSSEVSDLRHFLRRAGWSP